MSFPFFGPYGVRYRSNTPASNVPIRVELPDTSLATLFDDEDGLDPAPNPKLTDDLGNLFFYANPGQMFIVVSGERIPIYLPPLVTGSGVGYRHVQSSPLATWTMVHNLGKRAEPVFMLTGSTEPVFTDTECPDDNTTIATFDQPVSGFADF